MPPILEDNEQGDDTIVVKGEYGWTRPSSPESLSPEIEPLVANLLAQINPQRLESPEPYDESPAREEPSNHQQTRRITPMKRAKTNVTTMEDRLQQMPELRPLPWRPGVEEGADVETGGESRRKQIRYGCLLATRGEVQVPGCLSCSNGRGKFSVCVALDGYFKGACASCQLSGRPNRCSIKKEDDVIPSSAAQTPNGDGSLNNNSQQATPSSAPRSSGPPKKRRRTSEVKRAKEIQEQPPSLNEVSGLNPPPPHHQPPQWVQKQGQQTRQEVIDLPQRPWAAVNQPSAKPHAQSNGANGNGHMPQTSYIPSTAGWATVNQPKPQVPLPPQPQFQPQPAPVARPIHNAEESNGNGVRRNSERERRESTTGNEEGAISLIDSLPKNKQRQVYGLVSGLQGGIEHLQRELDSLKRALGIDDED